MLAYDLEVPGSFGANSDDTVANTQGVSAVFSMSCGKLHNVMLVEF